MTLPTTAPRRPSTLVAALAAVGLALAVPVDAAQRGTQRGATRGAQRGTSGRTPASRGSALEQGTRRLNTTPAADAGGRGVGGEDEQEAYPFGMPAETQQLVLFATADTNNSEWISFREAEAVLRFDADNFCVFDTDNDGRLTFEEFQVYIKNEATAGRSIREPVHEEYLGSPPRRTAAQLRSAYDIDSDGAISVRELERMLTDYDTDVLRASDASNILERLDANGSSVLETRELERIAGFLGPLVDNPDGAHVLQPGARSVLEMFGQPIPRGETVPPQIVGPVPLFRRLDVDNDGFIDIDDLKILEGGSFVRVRLASVLHTLDTDYDGRLNKAEFEASMTRPKRD